jgi:hypothetical protein
VRVSGYRKCSGKQGGKQSNASENEEEEEADEQDDFAARWEFSPGRWLQLLLGMFGHLCFTSLRGYINVSAVRDAGVRVLLQNNIGCRLDLNMSITSTPRL